MLTATALWLSGVLNGAFVCHPTAHPDSLNEATPTSLTLTDNSGVSELAKAVVGHDGI